MYEDCYCRIGGYEDPYVVSTETNNDVWVTIDEMNGVLFDQDIIVSTERTTGTTNDGRSQLHF